MAQVEFDDINEIRALHLLIMEAKFHPSPMNDVLQGSPYVAKVANIVLDAFEATDNDERITGEHKKAWRRASAHPDVLTNTRRRIARMKRDGDWSTLTKDQRINLVHDMLAPFEASNAEIREILQENHDIPTIHHWLLDKGFGSFPPWCLLDEHAMEHKKSRLQKYFPNEDYRPFAYKTTTEADYSACWLGKNSGTVVVIDELLNSTSERIATFSDYDAWLISAIEEMLKEAHMAVERPQSSFSAFL